MTDISVPLLDLKAQYANIREPVVAAIQEVCESQYFVMGPKVLELESKIAAYSGAAAGIGVSSGTDALLVALMALDVGPGDEVITSCYSFFATAGVIVRLGARPVLFDIKPDTYNIDALAVRSFLENDCERKGNDLVNKKSGGTVKILMPVHLFGQMADMAEISKLADEFKLAVVEDAAQAIGAEMDDGIRAGAIGDIGCFSFFPSKNLGAFGDGGMCVTQSEALAEKLGVLRLHGGKPKYYHSMVGGNFRLDALQAAVLLVKLSYLDEWTNGRQKNASHYSRALEETGLPIRLPITRPGFRHIFNQYIIEVDRRDELREHLKSRNVGTEVYYPVPLHLQQCFAYLGYEKGMFQVAESAASHSLALPIYPELTEAQLNHVVTSVADFFVGS